MNKKETTFIAILVLIAIVLTCTNLVSIAGLKGALAGMQSNLDALRFEIRNEVSDISDVFQAMQEEARWWESEDFEITSLSPGQAQIRFGGYLKDYRAGSKVFFNYRRQGEEAYTSLEAVEESSGYFYALLDLEYDPAPPWEQQIFYSFGLMSDTPEELITEAVSDCEQQFDYYVSVVDGDNVRVGDPESLFLDKLNYSYYTSLQSFLDAGSNSIDIRLLEMENDALYDVTAARLELCKGSRVVEKVSLGVSDESGYMSEWRAEAKAKAGEDYNVFRLVVTYSDGKSFTRQTSLAE